MKLFWKKDARKVQSDVEADVILRDRYLSQPGRSTAQALIRATQDPDSLVRIQAMRRLSELLSAHLHGAVGEVSYTDLSAIFLTVDGSLREPVLRNEALDLLFLFASRYPKFSVGAVSNIVIVITEKEGKSAALDREAVNECRKALMVLAAMGPLAQGARHDLYRIWQRAARVAKEARYEPGVEYAAQPWNASGLGTIIAAVYYGDDLRQALQAIDPTMQL